jgi:glyceraldehyde-3-phosphate dehydrogenase/erythrose-4-phosphate dehydrogenase
VEVVRDAYFLEIGTNVMTVFGCTDPKRIPWGEVGVEYVVECTGAFTRMDQARDHLHSGVKKVVIAGNTDDDLVLPSVDAPRILMTGLNKNGYQYNMEIVSIAYTSQTSSNPATDQKWERYSNDVLDLILHMAHFNAFPPLNYRHVSSLVEYRRCIRVFHLCI